MNSVDVHPSIRFSLALPFIFGFLPLSGIWNSDHKFLKFSWFSVKIIYSVFWIVCLFLVLLVEVYKAIFVDLSLKQTTNLAFYGSQLATNILFFKLAMDWPQLISEWHDVEVIMGFIGIKTNLKRKLKVVSTVFLLVATIEYVLVQRYQFTEISRKCGFLEDRLRKIYTHLYFYVFSFIDYSLCKAVFLHLITIRSTFSWTYTDVFLILISTSLAFRVKQFTTKVEFFRRSKLNHSKIWKELREEHYKLHKLCWFVSNKLSYLIFVSYGTNLYFILIQLFGSMQHLKSTVRKVYYCLSFALLIMRLVSVTLYGASVNEESKKILPLLFSVPSSSYNREVELLIQQVIKNEIVISARNFFKITKGLIIEIAGVIVTYELVLIQFHSYSFDSDENMEADKCLSISNYTYNNE